MISENAMEKAVVYGFGHNFFALKDEIMKNYSVVSIVDVEADKYGSFNGIEVTSPNRISNMDYDVVLVTPSDWPIIVENLVSYGIDRKKIRILYAGGGHLWNKYYGIVEDIGVTRAVFDDVTFFLRSNDEKLEMQRIFLHHDWDFWIDRPCFVVDIGMNIGLATLFFASRENVKKIFAYEPFPKTYRRAQENFRLNSRYIQSKIKSFNIGLGAQTEQKQVMYDENYTTNMRTDECPRESHGKESMEFIAMEDAGEIFSRIIAMVPDGVSLAVKMDCEGAEYDIFQRLEDRNLLKEIRLIMIETHDGRENEIKAILKKNGWAYFDNYVGDYPKISYMYAVNVHSSA